MHFLFSVNVKPVLQAIHTAVVLDVRVVHVAQLSLQSFLV